MEIYCYRMDEDPIDQHTPQTGHPQMKTAKLYSAMDSFILFNLVLLFESSGI
ncbi:MAG: hypothetical protein MJA31_02820 [Clostridia bacterium]|nr:hypothetical protein [Clostridia bacterium]